MKTIISLIFTVLFAMSVFTQNTSINYKALVKDTNGNVVSNQLVHVRFMILKGVSQTNVYTEDHVPTSDANGIVIVNIGEGTLASGSYVTIDWGSDEHHLNVQVDIGAGLVDMGTTEFKAVPYALSSADNYWAKSSSNVYNETERIGIGLDTPTGKLEVKHASTLTDVQLILTEDGTEFSRLNFQNDNTLTTNRYWTIAGLVETTLEDSRLNIWNGTTDLISITGDGKVGIGVGYTPSTDFHLANGKTVLFGTNLTGSGDKLMWLPNKKAFRAGTIGGTQWDDVNVGFYSTATGFSTIASGSSSTAFGALTEATGNFSVAFGSGTEASGDYSMATGRSTSAFGENSTAMGLATFASGMNSTTMGNGTLASGSGSTAMGEYNVSDSNALLMLGNGLSSIDRNSALVLKKNGDFVVGSASLDYDGNFNNSIRMFFSKQKRAFRAGQADGTQWDNANLGLNSFASGTYTKASGIGSTAMGNGTIASGVASTSIGSSTTASGDYSFATGSNTTASGDYSVSTGENTLASGNNSFASGFFVEASGLSSTSIGSNTIASGNFAFSTGLYNVDNPNAILSVGNGVSNAARANALTVLQNGKVGIGIVTPTDILHINAASGNSYLKLTRSATGAQGTNGLFLGNSTNGNNYFWTYENENIRLGTNNLLRMTIENNGNVGVGHSDPNVKLQIGNGLDASLSDGSGYVVVGIEGGENLVLDDNEIMARDDAGVSPLYIQKNGGNVAIGDVTPNVKLQVVGGSNVTLSDGTGFFMTGFENGTNIVFDSNEIQARNNGVASTLFLQHQGGNVAVNGSLVHTSDRRLKKDISALQYGLVDILKLNPVAYSWKQRPDQKYKSLGLIAQELQDVIPELVSVENDEQNTLHVNYTELIPVLIKAIQEQQDIINGQSTKIEVLSTELSDLKALDSRVKQLETLLKASKQ